MGLKSTGGKIIAHFTAKALKKEAANAVENQKKTLANLLKRAEQTAFGSDHNFKQISSPADFAKQTPIRDYEGHKPYVERIIKGEKDILWPGMPAYFCKTSGTTSGAKFIPLTKDSVPYHIKAAKNALLCYIAETGNAQFLDGKMMFLQGSPVLDDKNGIPVGRLSGITAHWVPGYLQKNRMPSWEINCIEDWEKKVDAVVNETKTADMRLISGIPSWVQMYFERLLEVTGKKNVAEVFPEFSLFVYGGLNYAPYRAIFKKLTGKEIPAVETYPASEGFIAFQDSQTRPGLLLNTNAGMFFEFVPANEINNENPTRLTLEEVETDVHYAIILSTNAGLWAYNIGDKIKFVSLNPYRIVVTGRVSHFISAFGEHVIAEEVESAMKETLEQFDAQVREFHLAPQVKPKEGKPYHEWFIEFENEPHNMERFSSFLNELMCDKNPYYKDLIEGKILRPLVISKVKRNGFTAMMKSRGKLGGQNKIPRLADDRQIADFMEGWLV